MSKDMKKANDESQQHLTSSMQIAFWWKKQIACFHVCFLLRSFWICWNATTLWRATFGLQKWFTYLVYKWKRYTVYKRKNNRKSEQRFIQYLHVLHFNVFIYNHPYLVVQYFWFHSQPRKWKRPLRRQHLCRLSLGRNGQVCVCLHALIKMIILVYIVYT